MPDAARPTTDEPGARSELGFARFLNVFGLVSPVANLGMLQVSPREMRWAGVVAGVLLWGLGAAGWAAHLPWAQRVGFGLHYALVALGLLHPRWPEVPFRWWTAFGRLLGEVIAIPIFTLLYFVAVTPLALVMRALGKDPLQRRAPPEESYWRDHRKPPRERFQRQF